LTNAGATFGQTSNFIDTHLQASDATVAPPATDRVLLIRSPAAAELVLYYALTSSDHAWRIPIPQAQGDDRNTDTSRVAFDDNTFRPNGMILVPGDDTKAWFSLSDNTHKRELHQLAFDPGFQ